jgi:flagellar basal body-associated protein FliL
MVSGKLVAIVIAVVIVLAVVAACTWLFLDYQSAPRQP